MASTFATDADDDRLTSAEDRIGLPVLARRRRPAFAIVGLLLIAGACGSSSDHSKKASVPSGADNVQAVRDQCAKGAGSAVDYLIDSGGDLRGLTMEIGTESPFFDFSLRTYSQWQGDSFRMGRQSAIDQAVERIRAWCTAQISDGGNGNIRITPPTSLSTPRSPAPQAVAPTNPAAAASGTTATSSGRSSGTAASPTVASPNTTAPTSTPRATVAPTTSTSTPLPVQSSWLSSEVDDQVGRLYQTLSDRFHQSVATHKCPYGNLVAAGNYTCKALAVDSRTVGEFTINVKADRTGPASNALVTLLP